MSNIICVHSYKGGTGKTLIAINLAVQLSKKYRVLLIEADFLMPCFFQIFSYNEISRYYNDFYGKKKSLLQECITPSSLSNLDLIYASPEYDPNDLVFSKDQKFHLTRLKAFLNQVGGLDYNYVIVDLAPGRNFVSISNLILAQIALVVLRPTFYSVIGTKNMLEDVYEKTKPSKLLPTFIIFNQVPLATSIEMKAQIEDWILKLQGTQRVTNSFVIPLSMEIALKTALGKTIFTEGEFLDNIQKIHTQILNQFSEKS